MLVALHSLAHTAEEVGLIAGILIGLAVIGRAFWGVWKFTRRMVDVVDWIEDIYIEFKPNSGKSIKDTVNRIDRNVTTNARNIEVVYGTVLKMHDLDPNDAALLETLDGTEQ